MSVASSRCLTLQPATTYVYDFENRLVQQGGATMVYDGDGNRVSKTVAGVTTTYLVDEQNPTGYAQVVSEMISGPGNASDRHDYVYGLEPGAPRSVLERGSWV